MKIANLLLLAVFVCSGAVGAQPPVILVLGDSLSSAHGLPVDQGWVNLMQQRLTRSGFPHRVVNASVSGDTTANGLTRLRPALEAHRPAIVIVELGGNDGLRAQPPPMIESNLERIVDLALKSGAKVIIAGMRLPPNYGPAYVERFESIYPRIAERTGSVLVPFFMDGVAAQPGMMQQDGVHPAVEAQEILLDNVWPLLLPILDSVQREDAAARSSFYSDMLCAKTSSNGIVA
jgi:acyl-CoA thioesterase-1